MREIEDRSARLEAALRSVVECRHSMQDWYLETKTGRRGCGECDEAKDRAREALREKP
jgi:hypothetical protein